MPFAVVREVRRAIPDRVLVAQLQSDLLEDIVHLCRAARIKSFASGNSGEFIEGALTFHAERTARVAATQNSDRVKHDIGFLQHAPQLVEGVTRIVVLTVTNQKQSALWMSATLYAFDAQIARVVKRGVAARLHERQLVEHCIAVARAVH